MKKKPKIVGIKNTDYRLIDKLIIRLPKNSNGVNFLIRARESYNAFSILIGYGLTHDAVSCLALSNEMYLKMILESSKLKDKSELKKIGHDAKKLFKIALKRFASLNTIKDDKQRGGTQIAKFTLQVCQLDFYWGWYQSHRGG